MVMEGAPWGRVRSGTSCGRHRAILACVLLSAACTHAASGTGGPPTNSLPMDAAPSLDALDAAGAEDSRTGRDVPRTDARFWVRGDNLPNPPDAGVSENAPRLLRPMSTSFVSSHRPTLSWTATGLGTDTLEICADRACTRVVQSATTTEQRYKPEQPLAIGTYFWRVSRVIQGTRRTSHVWQFRVRSRHDLTDYAYGNYHDFNGDGLDDLIIFGNGREGTQPFPFRGSPAGLVSAGAAFAEPQTIELVRFVGDINGDGFGDVLGFQSCVPTVCDGSFNEIWIFLGGPDGLASSPIRVADSTPFIGYIFGYGLGDVDGDGFGDVGVRPTPWGPPYHLPNVILGSGDPATLRSTTLVVEGCRTCQLHSLGRSNTGRHGEVVLGGQCMAGESGSIFEIISTSLGLPARESTQGARCASNFGGSLASIADIDGDGELDLAVNGCSHEFSCTSTPTSYFSRSNGSWRVTEHGEFDRAGSYALNLQDIDRDGMLDEIGSPSMNNIAVLFGSTDRWRWGPAFRVSLPSLCAKPVGSGDFDGDGLIEIVFICTNPRQLYLAEVAASGQIGPLVGLLTNEPAFAPFDIAY